MKSQRVQHSSLAIEQGKFLSVNSLVRTNIEYSKDISVHVLALLSSKMRKLFIVNRCSL